MPEPTPEDMVIDPQSWLSLCEFERGQRRFSITVECSMLAGLCRRLLAAEAEVATLLGIDQCQLDELMERWDQTEPGMQRKIVARFAGLLNESRDEVARLQALCDSLAARVAGQSELLTRRAEVPRE